MPGRIGRTCFTHRWLVVATWLVVIIAAGVGMKIGGGQLDSTFTIPGSQSQTALDQVKKDFPVAGGTSLAVMIGLLRSGRTPALPAGSRSAWARPRSRTARPAGSAQPKAACW